MFDVVDRDIVPRRAVRLGETFEPLPGLTIELFAVPGKVPLWLEEGEVRTDDVGEGTVGVAVEAGGAGSSMRPAAPMLRTTSTPAIAEADVLFFDGTLFADDEMIAERPRRQDRPAHGPHAGRRTGRNAWRRSRAMPMCGASSSISTIPTRS